MKKLIIAAFLLGLMSCEKEEVITPPVKEENTVDAYCLCSSVVSLGILGNGTYRYVLKNNCSGNNKLYYSDTLTNSGFCFDEAW